MQDHLREGETLFAQGKVDAAAKVFLEIIKQNPHNKDAFNNLGVIAFQRQDMEQAIEYFTKALEIDPFHKDAILNFSELLKSANRFHEIIPILENALAKFPDEKKIAQLLNEARQTLSVRPKVAFLCLPGLQSFLGDIVDLLKTKNDVRTCYSIDNQEIESAIHWADIVWLEWANELAIHVTHKVPSLSGKEVICRIHSYEVLHGYLPRIEWSKISKTIFVADHVLKIALEVCPSIPQLTKSVVIQNGVNLDKFPFRQRKPGFNIAVVGGINHKKNPSMWIEVLNRLMRIDDRYKLSVAGQIQDLRYKYYMEGIIPKSGLTNNIRLFGQVEDIPRWFEANDINYLLSTSPFESFGYAIAEAMAMGYRPLIHAFPGAEEIWPADCVFRCTDELIQMVRDKKNYNSQEYRQFVEKRYALQSQMAKIENLIRETASQISREKHSSELRPEKGTGVQRLSNVPSAIAKYDRPERTVILTGIPRSGTSLLSTLLNSLENAVCLNEILYDVSTLPSAFAEIRRRLIAGEPIPNRYDDSGKLVTDTQETGANIQNKVIQGVDENVVVGSKVNIPYLNHIQTILPYGYKIMALVRDPVYTIASWNSKKVNIIPEAHVTDEDMHPRWRNFSFKTNNRIERQAQIWQYYAELIWNLRDRVKIIKYGDLTERTNKVMQEVCEYLGLTNTITASLTNMNIPSRFSSLDIISQTVARHCPIAKVFGYQSAKILNKGNSVSSNLKPPPYGKRMKPPDQNDLKVQPGIQIFTDISAVKKPKAKEESPTSNVGPFVIFGRGHCGGRALCEAFVRNGIFMGKISEGRMDTVGFGLDNPKMLYLLEHAFLYPSLPREKQAELEAVVIQMVSNLAFEADGQPFGWKHGISIFCIEMLLRAYPEAKVVHLIRDGRDVMLSRLPARLNPGEIVKEHNKLAVFGRVDVNSYKGLPLPLAAQDEKCRNELEMIHWRTATEFGLRGRQFPKQYFEVHYETLCQQPVQTLTKVFDFLGQPLREETANWAKECIHSDRIGKWKNEVEDLTDALELGEPLLSNLGYTEGKVSHPLSPWGPSSSHGNKAVSTNSSPDPITSGTENDSNDSHNTNGKPPPQDVNKKHDGALRYNSDSSFKYVQKYCLFIGYPRSGHSLVGSLLDAHPNIVIAHELDALKYVAEGCEHNRLFQLILNNSQTFTETGRKWTGYSYEVPNQWQGKFTELRVIGDKKGGRSVWRLRSDPNILQKLRDIVGVEVKLIHVVRNPFDNITTIFNKEREKGLPNAIEFYFTMVDTVSELKKTTNGQELHEVSLESFIANPREQLTNLCCFLEVDYTQDYLDDCASIVFPSPRKTRHTVEWSPDLIQTVQETMLKYPIMSEYSYER